MQTKQQKLRTFICIDFPDEIIKEVSRIQTHIKTQRFTGKLTEPENLHLTLKFLGEVSESRLNQIKFLLNKVIFPEFEVTLTDAGTFNFKKQPRIVWIKIGGHQIFQLQKEIDVLLSKFFKPEERFMSHLTIARIKYAPEPINFCNFIKNLKVHSIKFPVKEFKLKSSELTPQGPVYRTIKIFNLFN